MTQCCVQGCDSFKNDATKNLRFFSFPTHNKILLKKWLHQIELPNCKPAHQKVCSAHFTKDDIAGYSDAMQLSLKPDSVPTIFPVHKSKNSDKKVSEWIVKKVPDDRAIKSANVDINKNCNMPLMQSLPMILVPSQYCRQRETQFPILAPGQGSQQIGLQNSPQIQQLFLTNPFNPGQSVGFSQRKKAHDSGQIFHFSQKNPPQIWLIQSENTQSSKTKSKLARVNAQNTVKISEIPQPKIVNQMKILRFSHANAQNRVKTLEFPQTEAKNASKQNPPPLSAIPPANVRKVTKFPSVSQTNVQSPTNNISRISSTNFQNPVKMSEDLKRESQNVTKTTGESENLKRKSENVTKITEESAKNVKNSNVLGRFSQRTKLQNSLPDAVEFVVPSFHETEQSLQISKSPTGESTTLQPKLTSNPDTFSTTIFKNPNDLSGSKSSALSCSLGNERPKLHITISKRYDISSESEMNSSVCKGENAMMDGGTIEKSITIENSRANRSVTFKLDRNTGEIVVETREINGPSTKTKPTRSRRRKRKKHTPVVLQTSSSIHKTSTRARRIRKKAMIPSTVSRMTTRSSKRTR